MYASRLSLTCIPSNVHNLMAYVYIIHNIFSLLLMSIICVKLTTHIYIFSVGYYSIDKGCHSEYPVAWKLLQQIDSG